MSGELYTESQKECNGYKQQNSELVRQLTSLMRRITPLEHNVTQPPQLIRKNESESAGKRGDDAEKRQQSSWLLDLTEEGDRRRESETSLSSPSFVNINSSSTDDSSHVTHAQTQVR